MRTKFALSPKYLFFLFVVLVTVIGCQEDNGFNKETLTIARLRSVVSNEIAQPHVDAVISNLIVKNSLSEDQQAQLFSLEEAVRNGTDQNAGMILIDFYAAINFDIDYLSHSETIAKGLEASYTFDKNDLVIVLWEKVYQRIEELRSGSRNGRIQQLPPFDPTWVNCAGTCQGNANSEYDGDIAEAEPGSTERTILVGQKAAYFAGCFTCCTSNCGAPE